MVHEEQAGVRPRQRERQEVSGALTAVLGQHISDGAIPGAAFAVQYGDETHLDAIGSTAYDGGSALGTDAIFRIASLTKPITAVATLILAEECRLRLHDPVDDLLPELADRRVLVSPDAPLDRTVPARRPITAYDLLTCRAGLGILLQPAESHPILREIERRRLGGFVPDVDVRHRPPDAWMRELGDLPLMAQPGERWLYNTSFSVLGVLIARASGRPYEQFVTERILEPLGMVDTGLSIPESERHRLVTAYMSDKQVGYPFEDPAAGPPVFPDASSGLVSTVADYLRFARMLRGLGTGDGARILSRPSVQAMATDQISDEQAAGGAPILDADRGWGLGVSVMRRRDRTDAVPGRYGWEGGSGTSWANDPYEDLTGIILTQRMFSEESLGVYGDFWTTVYRVLT